MSEKLTDDILMNCHYPDLVSASDRLKYYSDLGRETSSVWNFCSCSSDIISWGSQPIKKCRLFSQVMNRCPKGDILMYLLTTGFVPFFNKKFKDFSRTFMDTNPIFQGLHLVKKRALSLCLF